MENLEENTIYRLDHNAEATVAHVVFRAAEGETIVYAADRVWDITGYKPSPTDSGVRYTGGSSYFEFSPLVLEDAPEVFPHTIRTFKDIESFTEFSKKVINMAESYEVNTEPAETVSFTVDEEDNVLALIKVDNESGTLSKWEGEDWVEINEDEEHDDVFDQTVIDVQQEDIGAAIKHWTEAQASGQPVSKEDILVFADFNQ